MVVNIIYILLKERKILKFNQIEKKKNFNKKNDDDKKKYKTYFYKCVGIFSIPYKKHIFKF